MFPDEMGLIGRISCLIAPRQIARLAINLNIVSVDLLQNNLRRCFVRETDI